MTAHAPKILAVMGLPRSGTSMTMQMLFGGGFPCEMGAGPPAFEHRFTNIEMAAHVDWLETKRGEAVKLIDPLAMERHGFGKFPRHLDYAVIVCLRDSKQMARSQIKMMKATFPSVDDGREAVGRMTAAARRDQKALIRLARALDRTPLFLRFECTLAKPAQFARQIQDKCNRGLALEVMEMLVIPRDSECLDGFLEGPLALAWESAIMKLTARTETDLIPDT